MHVMLLIPLSLLQFDDFAIWHIWCLHWAQTGPTLFFHCIIKYRNTNIVRDLLPLQDYVGRPLQGHPPGGVAGICCLFVHGCLHTSDVSSSFFFLLLSRLPIFFCLLAYRPTSVKPFDQCLLLLAECVQTGTTTMSCGPQTTHERI